MGGVNENVEVIMVIGSKLFCEGKFVFINLLGEEVINSVLVG